MTHQHATIADTVYFWFGSNDTSGSGDDGAASAADVRLAGAAAGAIPVLSPVPDLLTHANYPDGCYEVAVDATIGNGFAAGNTYAVFCSLAVDAQTPTGFVGSFALAPIIANVTEISDDATAATNLELDYDGTGYAKANSTIGTTTTNTDLVTAAAVVNEWETQSQADPTGFHVNVLEIGGTAQTPNDNGADINAILVDTTEIGVAGAGLTNINLPNQTMDIVGSITGNLSGSVGSVTGAVGSVTGAVGSVTGAVGSVTGNVGGNVAGTVASVVGAVGSVTGNVGGNVAGTVASVVGAVGSVTGAVGSVTGNVGGNVAGSVASVTARVTANTDQIEGADATDQIRDSVLDDATRFSGANIDAATSTRATPAQVNAEVLDVLTVDTFAQPGQEAPASTTTLMNMIRYLYKAFRNRITQTAATLSVYADDATTVDHKAAVSDDTVTYDRGELGTGP